MIFLAFLLNLVQANAPAREWLKLPLRTGTFFDQAVPAPADHFLIPTKKQGFLPPVAYVERKVERDDESDRIRIRNEILTALDVHPFARSTVELESKPFKAGEKRDLPASLTLVQSAGTETMLTCIGIVKDGEILRVFWVQAFQASLTDCRTPFLDIARSPALARK